MPLLSRNASRQRLTAVCTSLDPGRHRSRDLLLPGSWGCRFPTAFLLSLGQENLLRPVQTPWQDLDRHDSSYLLKLIYPYTSTKGDGCRSPSSLNGLIYNLNFKSHNVTSILCCRARRCNKQLHLILPLCALLLW